MDEKTKGKANDTKLVLDLINLDERKRALKLKKRAKKKTRKQRDKQATELDQQIAPRIVNEHQNDLPTHESQNDTVPTDGESIEYVASPINLSSLTIFGPNVVQEFNKIFNNFEYLGSTKNYPQKRPTKKPKARQQLRPEPTLSKKKAKKAQGYTLDELKALATAPNVVEDCDISARDPLLLVDLKSYRNTVPVPLHWSQRQKYLYRYRSDEKPAFELPDYIKDTGIMQARDNLKKQEEHKRQKAKTREKRKPKLGKMDLEYQALHDAFFRFQTKPRLTRHGDLYYERKETDSELKNMKPGQLSDELKEALGILDTPLAPPPWLFQMQRYGPPPNHPHLKIPGLNAPLPEGAQWGRQKYGWGQVPVDAFNRPLYGDVFTIPKEETTKITVQHDIQKELWGELEDGIDKDEDDSDENSDNDIEDIAKPNLDIEEEVIPLTMDVNVDLETKKRKRRQSPTKDDDTLPKLYDIIPSRKTSLMTGDLMSSQHTYDLPKPHSFISQPWTTQTADVTISLDPADLDNYGAAVQDKYEQAQLEHLPKGIGDQSLKDMYTDHVQHQAKKKRQMEIKNLERKKDFKF